MDTFVGTPEEVEELHTHCRLCNEEIEDGGDDGYCTLCAWDIIEEAGGDREDPGCLQEDWF